MKNNGLFAVVFSFFIVIAPLHAQEIETIQDSQQDTVAQQIEDEAPTRDFDSILNQLETVETNSDDFENGLIDPDFLKDEGKSYDDYKIVTLRFLNKITAESETFDLTIDKTVAYGSLRIRPKACKKSPPIEEPESVSFLQIWEKMHEGDDEWVFSGWMFASSPSLSSMEHPVYDVWVIDCKDQIKLT